MRFATNKVLTLFFCLLFIFTTAQNEFTAFSKNTGLTSSTILFTFVDSKGIIWAATNYGVNAFTGKKWVAIKSIADNDGNEQTLGQVLKIFESSNRDLWFATEKGIFHFNRKYWVHFSDSKNKDFAVHKFFQDRSDNLWILLEKKIGNNDLKELGFSFVEGRVQMFNGNQWFDLEGMIGGSSTVIIGEPKEYFTSIIQAQNNDIWVTSLDGLYNYNGNKWTEYNEEHLSSDRCYGVIETSKNEIWVATANGISKQDGDKWIKYEKDKGIKDNIPYNLFEDKENRIWAFTRKDNKFKSLCFFENGKWESCFNKEIQIKGNVSQILEFDGKMLAFSSKGISLFHENKWNNLKDIFELKDDNFSAIITSNDSSIYFTGQKGLYNLKSDGLNKVFSPTEKWKVSSLLQASNGSIWIGTEKNGLFNISNNSQLNYTTNNGLIDNNINFVFEDKRKNIWVVSKNGISIFKK